MLVVVLDNNKDVRNLLVDELEISFEKIKVLEASSCNQAFDYIKDYQNEVKLIICSYRMPKRTCGDLYHQVSKMFPTQLPFIFILGEKPDKELKKIMDNPDVLFLRKPWGIDGLTDHVKKLISE
ncbi:response regulator [bacterium]|nr:response regulator [bacterium]